MSWEIRPILLLIVIVQEHLMIMSMEHGENVNVFEENIHFSAFLEFSAASIVMIAALIVLVQAQKIAMFVMTDILIRPLDAQSVIVLVRLVLVRLQINV